MADVTYRFLFESTGTGTGTKKRKKSVASTMSGESAEGKKADSPSALEAISSLAPFGYALKFATKQINAEINRVELRTGNAILQEKISYTYSTAGRIIAIGAAVVGGLATGNYLAAGAGLMSALSWGVDMQNQRINIDLSRRIQGIGIGMANIRAGAGGNRNASTVDY